MAATWQVVGHGIPLALANESLLAVYNNSASDVLKFHRIWLENCTTTALTGAQNILTLTRYIGGTITANSRTFTPISYDSANAALPSGITAASKMTIATPGTTQILRRIPWTNDEPTIQAGFIDEFLTPSMWAVLWDTSYQSTVEPLILRPTQTLSVQNIGLTATAPANAGMVDIFMEFTVA